MQPPMHTTDTSNTPLTSTPGTCLKSTTSHPRPPEPITNHNLHRDQPQPHGPSLNPPSQPQAQQHWQAQPQLEPHHRPQQQLQHNSSQQQSSRSAMDLNVQIAVLMADKKQLMMHAQPHLAEPQSLVATEEAVQTTRLAAIEAATCSGEEKRSLPEIVPGFKLSTLNICDSTPTFIFTHTPPLPPTAMQQSWR
ncbi:hypothetical protein JB92DRAFT_2828445 [Gautieria morchelliformis]|nr:hypothetical protein JB92DRAFT_2828445 [Gautieria morchelliformis]